MANSRLFSYRISYTCTLANGRAIAVLSLAIVPLIRKQAAIDFANYLLLADFQTAIYDFDVNDPNWFV